MQVNDSGVLSHPPGAISAKPSENPELSIKSALIKNFHLTPGYFSVVDHS